MQKQNLDLTKDRIGVAILAFALPIMLGSLIQQLYTMTDAVIVGKFAGKMGLAAIDSVHTLFKFPINFMNGLAAGATILISSAFGAKDFEQTRRSVRSSIAVAVVLGVVASVGGVLLSPWLLRLLSVPQDIYRQTLTYTRIYFGGLWSMVLYNMVAGILRAMGDTKRPLYVLVTSCITNILGDILLVGVFRMGVAGAAAATAAAQIISAAAICRCLDRTLEGGIFGANQIRIPVGDMLSIFKTGMPLALQSTLFPIANTIVQAGVNQMGTDAIAAWGICGKLDMLIWLIADTMSPALTTYVAQNIGGKTVAPGQTGNIDGGRHVCWGRWHRQFGAVYRGRHFRALVYRGTGCGADRPPGVPLYGANVSVLCILYLCGVLFRGLLRNRRYPWPYGDDAFEYLPVPGHRHPVCASEI